LLAAERDSRVVEGEHLGEEGPQVGLDAGLIL
jgi:hypothetical protein